MNEEHIITAIKGIYPDKNCIERINEKLGIRKKEFRRRMYRRFKVFTAFTAVLFTVGILPITLFAKKISNATHVYICIIEKKKTENPRDIFEFLEMLLKNWETIYLFFLVFVIAVLVCFSVAGTVKAHRSEYRMENK